MEGRQTMATRMMGPIKALYAHPAIAIPLTLTLWIVALWMWDLI